MIAWLLAALPSLACSCDEDLTLSWVIPSAEQRAPTNTDVLLYYYEGWRPADTGTPPDVSQAEIELVANDGEIIAAASVEILRANGGWVLRVDLAEELRANTAYKLLVRGIGRESERQWQLNGEPITIRTGEGRDDIAPSAPQLSGAEARAVPEEEDQFGCTSNELELQVQYDPQDTATFFADDGRAWMLFATGTAWNDHSCAGNVWPLDNLRLRAVDLAGNESGWSNAVSVVRADTGQRPCGCASAIKPSETSGLFFCVLAWLVRRRRRHF